MLYIRILELYPDAIDSLINSIYDTDSTFSFPKTEIIHSKMGEIKS